VSSMGRIGKYVGITGLLLAVLAMASGTGFAATYFLDIDDTAANEMITFTQNFFGSTQTTTLPEAAGASSVQEAKMEILDKMSETLAWGR